jgi:hypothetical protein
MVPIAQSGFDHIPRRAGIVPALIVLILLSLALSQSVGYISGDVGLDFYHFWGVPVAMRLAGQALGPPYGKGRPYADTLAEYAAKAGDPKLKAVTSIWRGGDFTASPLLYTAFTWVSNSYTGSLVAFRTLQLVLFLASVLLLGYLFRLDPFYLACLALLSVLFYQPLMSDLRVANLGCFQLAALTGLLCLAWAVARAPSFARRATLGAVFLAALAALTLCKPNVLLITALLAAHLAVRHGPRLFLVAALPAAAAAAGLVAIPCVYFGSWTVWREWYDFVYGSNAYMLVRRVNQGNYSTALLLSSWLGFDVYIVSSVLLVILGGSLLVAVAWPHGPHAPAESSAGAVALGALRRLFGEPRLALAIGTVLTIASAPLYWFHYYVISLIPSLWLLSAPASARSLGVLAAAAVVLSSGMLALLFSWLQWSDALPASIALSWLPLWCAILRKITAPDADAMPAGGARLTDARAVVAPPPRRRKR